MDYDFDIGVIGAGSGGLSVTYFCTSIGLKTILFEGREMGGDCLNHGCVPSKAFIKSSKVNYLVKNASLFGIDNVSVTESDGEKVFKRVRDIIAKIAPVDSQERYENMGTTIIRSHALFKDKHTLVANEKSYRVRKIIIATGSSPVKPDIKGFDKVGYLNNESFFDLDKLPRSLIMAGSGPIGIELSMAMARLGVKVTILEKSDYFIPRFDIEISDVIKKKCKALGIDIICGAEILSADSIDGIKQVNIKDQKGTRSIKTDEIFSAIGRRPNIFDLGLDDIGIRYTKRGITVDKHLRTNVKNIFAIGDCNGQMPFTHGAGYEAGVVIRNMIFKIPTKTDYFSVPWVLYSDPEVASVGFSEKELDQKGIEYVKHKAYLKDIDRAVTEGSEEGFVKILTNKKGRLIGAVIVAQNAGEMVPLLVMIAQYRIKASKIASLTFSYPTMAEGIKRSISSDVLLKLIGNKLIRKFAKILVKL